MGGEDKDHRGKRRRRRSERCQIFYSSRDKTVSGLVVVWGASCECGIVERVGRCEVSGEGGRCEVSGEGGRCEVSGEGGRCEVKW